MENLETSVIFTAVREMLGILVKVWEMSGKIGLKLLLLAAYLHPFLNVLSLHISFWYRIMHYCIPTPTTDNNTSTGVIWVTFNMGSSAANCQGHVMEFHTA